MKFLQASTKHLLRTTSSSYSSFAVRSFHHSSVFFSDNNNPQNTPPPTNNANHSKNRGEQAKGAMREYLQNVSKSTGNSEGLWARLRKGFQKNNESATVSTKQSQQSPKPQREQKPFVKRPSTQTKAPTTTDAADSAPKAEKSTEAIKKAPVNRVVNKRFNNNDSGKFKKYKFAGSSSGKASAEGEGNAGSIDGRRKRKGGEFSRGERRPPRKEVLTASMESILFDHEYFAKKMGEGYISIDDNEFDPLDALMARGFIESYKTSSNSYEAFLQNPHSRRVVLPKPRSMVQLVNAMQPRITVPANTAGYTVAEAAWGVLQKNYYYRESQKATMSVGIAKDYNHIMNEMNNANIDAIDEIFDPRFRKGLRGIEEEERRKQLLELSTPVEKEVEQGETDWSVQAVEDEDQL